MSDCAAGMRWRWKRHGRCPAFAAPSGKRDRPCRCRPSLPRYEIHRSRRIPVGSARDSCMAEYMMNYRNSVGRLCLCSPAPGNLPAPRFRSTGDGAGGDDGRSAAHRTVPEDAFPRHKSPAKQHDDAQQCPEERPTLVSGIQLVRDELTRKLARRGSQAQEVFAGEIDGAAGDNGRRLFRADLRTLLPASAFLE